MSRLAAKPAEVVYPDSDGQPMAENTIQFRWIQTIQGNLDIVYRSTPGVFVAGDHLIYPVEGNPAICMAPDVYVAFGRPKKDRGSYKVWEEDGVFPQVVFEIRSPSNRQREMVEKYLFYDEYGADEYYDYDPDRNRLRAYVRARGGLEELDETNNWVSPRLGVRFDTSGPELILYRADGRRFLTVVELGALAERTTTAEQRAETAEQRADAAAAELDRLREKLKAAGIDPDSLG